MVNRIAAAAVGVAFVLGATTASAQSGKGKIVFLDGDLIIVGRIQKPLATVEVARVPQRITLTEIREPFLERIGKAVARDPY